MLYSLPALGKNAIELKHFPTRHQAFIFRAYEYFSASKIAEILRTDEENVKKAAYDMGLPEYERRELWFKRGYITVIRRMWHILPYDQLLELLETDEGSFAKLLRDDDFLDVKLKEKPYCQRVEWRELTEEEKQRTKKIKEIMLGLDLSGKKPF